MMARARGELAISETAKLAAQRLLADREPELFPDPLRQVDQSPSDHTMRRRDWSGLDHTKQRVALLCVELS